MTVRELRRKYLDFFIAKGHSEHASGSLVPYDVTGRLDESLLFNGAGMVQFKPYFRGAATPPNRRLTTSQKCLRTGDIEEVGDDTHLTFFEMLGNFSFGDYFKKEAIAYSWEFLTSTEWLGLDPRRLAFTVFSEDDEAESVWAALLTKAGIDPATRIFRLGEETNYWPAGSFSKGPPGPCGPNSEMFYWTGDGEPPSGPYSAEDYLRDEGQGKWLEIWNDVFIQYEWQGDLRDPARPDLGYEKRGLADLPFRSIDTGMGIERTVAVLNGFRSVYDTDAFQPIFRALEGLKAGLAYGSDAETTRAMRIVADHLRAATFCIADGVLPSNGGRGYVLRRLIRRAVRTGVRKLGFETSFLRSIGRAVVDTFGDHYHHLQEKQQLVFKTLEDEESAFLRTLDLGEREFRRAVTQRFKEILPSILVYHVQGNREMSGYDVPESLFDLGAFLSHSGSLMTMQRQDQAANSLFDRGMVREVISSLRSQSQAVLQRAMVRFAGNVSQERIRDDYEVKMRLIEDLSIIPASTIFKLKSTYGLPIEMIREDCHELGLTFSEEELELLEQNDQSLSRQGRQGQLVYGARNESVLTKSGQPIAATNFLGYPPNDIREHSQYVNIPDDRTKFDPVSGVMVATSSQVEALRLDALENGSYLLSFALKETVLFAESGGQVSDQGVLYCDLGELPIFDVQRQGDVFVHFANVLQPSQGSVWLGRQKMALDGAHVRISLDIERRTRIQRHHTATHLLHAALRERLGTHVTQAGSRVDNEELRFDFTHGAAMTDEELADVEARVNAEILRAQGVVTYPDVPLEEARAMGAMALFGEKYADRVRVVQIGDMPPTAPSFSRELCGGTHVANTGQIGLFKIRHESSAAGGVRRIVAVAGDRSAAYVRGLEDQLARAAHKLKSSPAELETAIEKLQEALKEERKKRERLAQQGGAASVESVPVGSVTLLRQVMDDADAADAKAVADRLIDQHPLGVALIANRADGKVTFVAKVGPAALKAGAHAGNLVKAVATAAGGGGGGRPDFATAGGRDPGAVETALEAGRAALAGMVGA